MLDLIFLTTIYGLANLYLFFKLSHITNFGIPVDIFLGLFVLFMALSPVLIRLYSLRCPDKPARVFAYIGYMWVAFLILYFPMGILLEAYYYAVRHGDFLYIKDLNSLAFAPSYTFFIPFFISIAFNIYGFFEARNLRVERLTVKTSKLPEGIDKLTIAQISDLHLGIIVRDKTLDKVINEIEIAKPDLIVSTGDLLDGVVGRIDYLTDKFKMLHARLGKFAVIGNHEFYGGLKHALKFIEEAGFTVLRGRGVTIEGMLNIVGVDDLIGENNRHDKDTASVTERDIFSKLPSDVFTLLLKHRSDVDSSSVGLFDLQLSGHTHKGQIFPVNLITLFIFQHHTGYIKLSNDSALYVSRGAGTGGPPVRFLSPPEITIIEIVPK